MALIEVENVTKDYKIYEKKTGFANTVKSIFIRTYSIKQAVNNISFSIDKGELVGYIGPNGAGKSTTLKMLSGILVPTQGKVTVNGLEPYKNRRENAKHIGVVFGQRSQLFWDLPMEDTFALFKKMYHIDDNVFRHNLDFYIELLDMKDFLKQPVRQLSLGQKMRANIAVALLHDPEIVYLDEPTIGLDVVAKKNIRNFIRAVNEEKHTTVILTTHDMDDIEIICNRLIMINSGEILYDGRLDDFKRRYSGESVITIEFENETELPVVDARMNILKHVGNKYWVGYNKDKISPADAVFALAKGKHVVDLCMQETDIEDIVRNLYENRQDMAKGGCITNCVNGNNLQ